jgi:serine/threonine protein kinase
MWYMAPEQLVGSNTCFAADMWSAGCILAELLGRKALFPGRSYIHMLRTIVAVTGTPAPEDMSFMFGEVPNFVLQMEKSDAQSFDAMYPDAHHEATDLLSKLLVFDPRKRLSVEQALKHPYFQEFHDPGDEPVCAHEFDFDFEIGLTSKEECRELVQRECELYSMRRLRYFFSLLFRAAQSSCQYLCRSLKLQMSLHTARVHAQKAVVVATDATLPLWRAQRLQLLSTSSLFSRLARAFMSLDVPSNRRRMPLQGLLTRLVWQLLIRNNSKPLFVAPARFYI